MSKDQKYDDREPIEVIRTLEAAIPMSNVAIEGCSMYAFACSYKARWGCPSRATYVVSAVRGNDDKAHWEIHTYPVDPRTKNGGLYWILDGILMAHCGITQSVPVFKKENPPILESPFDLTLQAPRSDQIVIGRKQMTLRHHLQHSGVRHIKNQHVHGLPLNFGELCTWSQQYFHQQVYDQTQIVLPIIEDWVRQFNHEAVVFTAMASHQKLPFFHEYPVVDMRTSDVFDFDATEQVLTLHLPFNGRALRNYRMLPTVFEIKGLVYAAIVNGGSGDWGPYRWHRHDTPVPFPKSALFYIAPNGAGNMWCKAGYLASQKNRNFFYNSLTVYGGDEYLATMTDQVYNVILDREAAQRPMLLYPENQCFQFKVAYWTWDYEFLKEFDWMMPSTYTEVSHLWKPNKNRNGMKLAMEEPTFEQAEPWVLTMVDLLEYSPVMQTPFEWLGIFLFLWFYFRWLFYMYPAMLQEHKDFTYSDQEYPIDYDADPEKDKLCIVTHGSRGDTIPMSYYGNLACYLGIKTHNFRAHVATTDDLDALSKGDMTKLIPGFARLLYAGEFGYKAVLQPHAEVSGSGSTYRLSAPKNLIKDAQYVYDYHALSLFRKVAVFIAETFDYCFMAQWQIGSLKGCHLPRSANGLSLIRKRSNLATHPVGWCSGSANETIIPAYIRQNFPQVPNGDHNELFRDYKIIHMHGGAGTVQTALAAGAIPISHDQLLDRNYKVQLYPKDFHQPNVSAFYGWLLYSGYTLQLPLWVQCYGFLTFLWRQKVNLLLSMSWSLLNAYLLYTFLIKHQYVFVLVLTTMPIYAWRLLRKYGIMRILRELGKLYFRYPILLVFGPFWQWLWIPIFMVPWGTRIIQDINSTYDRDFELVFEPVNRQLTSEGRRYTFFFPLGHWCIRDYETHEVYEGYFTDSSNQTIGGIFGFQKSKRPISVEAKLFPCPVNKSYLTSMLRFETPKPYSGVHNCSTYVVKALTGRGIIVQVLMSIVSGMILIALTPPHWLRWLFNKLLPTIRFEDTRFYNAAGFAAADNNWTFETEQITEKEEIQQVINVERSIESFEQTTEGAETGTPSFDEVCDEIANLHAVISSTKLLHEDQVDEIAVKTLEKQFERTKPPDHLMTLITPIPPYVLGTYAQAVTALHEAIGFIRKSELVNAFIGWLNAIANNWLEFASPILHMLTWFLDQAYKYTRNAFKQVYVVMCKFIDLIWGLEESKRAKTVWGLMGITGSTSMLSAKARLALSIQMSKRIGRTDFIHDYDEFTTLVKQYAKNTGASNHRTVGGPQRRPVRYSKPVMSRECAELTGFKPGEYETPEGYEEQIQALRSIGVQQGVDGVLFGEKHPERIARSINRYEPRYPDSTPEQRAMMWASALALFEKYPETFANMDIMLPEGVIAYIKEKYSPGAPFISPRSFPSRQAMFDAGYVKVLIQRCRDCFENGIYPLQWYHAFAKSQVVAGQPLQTIEEGGKMKDLRTVVSQDMFSYMVDQVLQIPRNKLTTFSTYGSGSGMVMNQTMAQIFVEMAEIHRQKKGLFIEADAQAFDSGISPPIFDGLKNLATLGFKDHPSGNGKAMASVLSAKYDAMQDAWIFGITEPEYYSLTIGAKGHDSRKWLEENKAKIKNLVPLAELIDFKVFKTLSKPERIKYVQHLEVPDGVTILTWNDKYVPNTSHWMGAFEFGDTNDARRHYHDHQELLYTEDQKWQMLEDVKKITNSNFSLLSNVHYKNRGGGTGQSATSWDNTAAYRLAMIASWAWTTGRDPKEFFEYNILKNTSDDAIWHSHGEHGIKTTAQVMKMKEFAASLGVTLTLNFSHKMSEMEYLSKFVEYPTKETTREWQALRSFRIEQLLRHDTPQTRVKLDKVLKEKMPPMFIRQDTHALWLRETGYRYYQSSLNRYLWADVQRYAGQGTLLALDHGSYQRSATKWCDTVNRLCDLHDVRQRYVLRFDKYGMSEVHQTNPRWKEQALSGRQQYLLKFLKDNKILPYMKVLQIHFTVKENDPSKYERFITKLNKNWKSRDQLLRELVDGLYGITNSIPDAWSKKFQPNVDMTYVDIPLFSKNQYNEWYVISCLLKEFTEEEITFSMFASRIQESPYGSISDPYLFWERWNDLPTRQELKT